MVACVIMNALFGYDPLFRLPLKTSAQALPTASVKQQNTWHRPREVSPIQYGQDKTLCPSQAGTGTNRPMASVHSSSTKVKRKI